MHKHFIGICRKDTYINFFTSETNIIKVITTKQLTQNESNLSLTIEEQMCSY